MQADESLAGERIPTSLNRLLVSPFNIYLHMIDIAAPSFPLALMASSLLRPAPSALLPKRPAPMAAPALVRRLLQVPGWQSDVGAIAGGVVGGVVGLALIATLLWFFCIKKRKNHRDDFDDMMVRDPWLQWLIL
jgi:hypothetical protein